MASCAGRPSSSSWTPTSTVSICRTRCASGTSRPPRAVASPRRSPAMPFRQPRTPRWSPGTRRSVVASSSTTGRRTCCAPLRPISRAILTVLGSERTPSPKPPRPRLLRRRHHHPRRRPRRKRIRASNVARASPTYLPAPPPVACNPPSFPRLFAAPRRPLPPRDMPHGRLRPRPHRLPGPGTRPPQCPRTTRPPTTPRPRTHPSQSPVAPRPLSASAATTGRYPRRARPTRADIPTRLTSANRTATSRQTRRVAVPPTVTPPSIITPAAVPVGEGPEGATRTPPTACVGRDPRDPPTPMKAPVCVPAPRPRRHRGLSPPMHPHPRAGSPCPMASSSRGTPCIRAT